MESIESEEQKEKRMKTSEESLWDPWEIDEQSHRQCGTQKEKTERREKKISAETTAERFPNMMEDRYKYPKISTNSQ